ncbi:MAG: hypothetical protein NT141_04335 [candidate division WWE3 bacterium]|nr:hypothetical protein [candidate division WWE3 bacterium]
MSKITDFIDAKKDQASTIKKQLAMKKQMEEMFLETEEHGVKIKMRGDFRVESLEVGGVEDKRLREAINKAFKETQKKLAKKFQGQM